jgi:single-strand DNA-binding protein
MRGVNAVHLLGYVGGDPEVRYTASGTPIANLSVATSEQWTDKATGQKQERTEWHRCTAFGRLAEIAGEYVKKGHPVYVLGRLRTDKYKDKEGVERYTTKIMVAEIQLLPASKEKLSRKGSPESPPRSAEGAGPQYSPPAQDDSLDDEIPF